MDRNEAILTSIITDTDYGEPPQSRNEALLLELKKKIASNSNSDFTPITADEIHGMFENSPNSSESVIECES